MPTQVGTDYELSFSRDSLDVTSNHRPDTDWIFIDNHGHEHRWFDGDSPAIGYSPRIEYVVPSVLWIATGLNSYEDGSTYETGEYRCVTCGDIVEPGYTADHHDQYIASDKVNVSGWCLIDHRRGFELLISLKRVSLSEVLRDVKDYESIVDELPDCKVFVTKSEYKVPDKICKVWFQS